MQVADQDEYGALSPKWLVRILTQYVPRQNVNAMLLTVFDMLYDIIEKEDSDYELDTVLLLQVMVQTMATGQVIMTGDLEEIAEQLKMTPEQIDRMVAGFAEQLDKTLDTAPDVDDES